jgi:hypothetical protein
VLGNWYLSIGRLLWLLQRCLLLILQLYHIHILHSFDCVSFIFQRLSQFLYQVHVLIITRFSFNFEVFIQSQICILRQLSPTLRIFANSFRWTKKRLKRILVVFDHPRQLPTYLELLPHHHMIINEHNKHIGLPHLRFIAIAEDFAYCHLDVF